MLFIAISRCIASLLLFRDYSASWSKSTPKTFLRKMLINSVVLVPTVLLFYGKVRFAIIFSEYLFYIVILNFCVFLYFYLVNRSDVRKTKSVVIYGAGAAGAKVANEFVNTEYRVKFFVDDNVLTQRRSVGGVKVISRESLKKYVISDRPDLLIIAIPSSSNKAVKYIYNHFQDDFAEIKIMPSLENILQNESFTSQLKKVSLYDLLSRDSKSLNTDSIHKFIKDSSILITGAGGSIGSEIARQCLKFGAKKIILLDHSEYNLYKIYEELSLSKNVIIEPIMCSVVNLSDVENIFKINTIDIIFHAAAYKHVPLVESNISAAIHNNIIGTKNIIDTGIKYDVNTLVLISTDKAVRPTNVMGATKRVCELYLQNVEPKNTKLAAVRFGNVLGSSGSVIPRFEDQIKNGGPLTVTHADITRYFMLIPEACELVLQAGAIAKNSEVFVLDMGEPVKIMDLAKQFKKLSDREDVEIKITGLRPGEKLYEELLVDVDDVCTDYKDIFIGRKTCYDIKILTKHISDLQANNSNQLDIIKKIVPEFQHRLNG